MNTPTPTQSTDSHRIGLERLDLAVPPALFPPRPQSASRAEEHNMTTATQTSTSPSKENESPLDAGITSNYPLSPTRTGTTTRGLSWQRRPNSQASEQPKARPLSVATFGDTARSFTAASEQEAASDIPSRDQIASALSSKDPSWFRQTADRGATSAAYRRNQVEDTQTVDHSFGPVQLPGMVGTTSGGSFKNGESSPQESLSLRRSTITSPTSLSDAQRLDPPSTTAPLDAQPSQETRGPFPPSLGRTSPTKSERPVSPTKGTGGFVQSAMLKRSESVSKRWSVQSPTGLQRADPIASTRSGYDPTHRKSISSKVRPTNLVDDNPMESARPRSSESKEADRPKSRVGSSLQSDTAGSPELQGQDSNQATPPISPSKTMDPRRWSPQKSSWLESALNKPESPKPVQSSPSQPAWMADLQKAKAQKASNPGSDSSKAPATSHKHTVSIGGLLRSSAPGVTAAPVGRGGLHSPSPSISSINAPTFLANAKPNESQPAAVPNPVKSRSDSIVEIKQPASPLVNKAKPETPPKKDFRANLKPRAPLPTSSTTQPEVEFKNVFGHLRKATIQNYVAPDELKNNITQGKAALAVTGGPQKSERVDEFKEAILAKKKEFQTTQSEGRVFPRNNSVSSETPVPEGILKRAELGRTATLKRGSISSEVPAMDSRPLSTVSQRASVLGNLAGKFEHFSNLEKRGSVIEAPNSRLDAQRTSSEPSIVRKLSIPHNVNSSADKANEANVPARVPGKIAGSALANRFNPALAGLLSRGPPTASGNSGSTASSEHGTRTNAAEAGPGPALTHMTKNRARGPRRKAPTTSSTLPTTTEPKSDESKQPWGNGPSVRQGKTTPLSPTEIVPLADPSKKEFPRPLQPRPKPITITGASGVATQPMTLSEPTVERPKTANKIHEQIAVFTAQGQTTTGTMSDEPQISPQPPSPGKLNMNRMSRFMDAASAADKESNLEQTRPLEIPLRTKSSPDEGSIQDAQQKPRPRSPSLNKPRVPLPTSSSLPTEKQPPRTEIEVVGANSNTKVVPQGARPLPTPPAIAASKSPNSSEQLLAKEPERDPRSISSSRRDSQPVATSRMRSPAKSSSDTSGMLRDFFGPDRPRRSYRVDTAELLIQRPSLLPPKIHTLSAQLFQFTPDGKRQPVPAHHERTLFEGDMYLCAHSFNDSAGKKTLEVYLWAGVDVPEAIVEDAAVFAARETRSFGGTLVRLKQGKETPEFLQALGGIVITQRGPSNKYDSLAPHMLCGRRYGGHIVLDEVDFTASTLCSGFPYIITQGGRCYLWKGKGSDVDELSCARLIGMDYALSGELEEIEEGHEPVAFWELFGGANRFGSADHWRLKPGYDKYCSRLFLSDAASMKQVGSLRSSTRTL